MHSCIIVSQFAYIVGKVGGQRLFSVSTISLPFPRTILDVHQLGSVRFANSHLSNAHYIFWLRKQSGFKRFWPRFIAIGYFLLAIAVSFNVNIVVELFFLLSKFEFCKRFLFNFEKEKETSIK